MQAFCRRVAVAGSALACVPMPLLAQVPGQVQLQESSSTLLTLVLAAVALLAVVGVLLVRRRATNASSRRHAYPDPPLVFPIPPGEAREPAAFPQTHLTPDAPPREAAPARPIESAPPPLPANGAPRAAPVVTVPVPIAEEALPPVDEHPGAANGGDGGVGGEYVDGRTVRYYRPVDDTVQFLPGRLEIVEGEDRGQDIRFIRTAGGVAEITFGRSSGPAHRHVQLRARTVSREHARLRYERDGWRIGNLSQTNPVVVNGEELHSVQDTRALSDGDLIEMGEVVFRFRER
ncbi:MAG TPA: FHA domain-containing protein [Longimicrobiaceae bacterium]|nr:FHA domain-containing protein [Longimicrobiaceae bacterium]